MEVGSWDNDGAGPVGVEGAGGRDSERSELLAVGVVGVLDLELLKSFRPPPLTLVRLVPAAARSCC